VLHFLPAFAVSRIVLLEADDEEWSRNAPVQSSTDEKIRLFLQDPKMRDGRVEYDVELESLRESVHFPMKKDRSCRR
jgi:hypothetical protein